MFLLFLKFSFDYWWNDGTGWNWLINLSKKTQTFLFDFQYFEISIIISIINQVRMTKLVCQNNISSIFIVQFKISSLENLKISVNIPPDRLNSWLTNTGREIKTVSVSRPEGCQVQWVCSYLISLLLLHISHCNPSLPRAGSVISFFILPLFVCQVERCDGVTVWCWS